MSEKDRVCKRPKCAGRYTNENGRKCQHAMKWKSLCCERRPMTVINCNQVPDEDYAERVATEWEQWFGVVSRGKPRTLKLFRLRKPRTRARAPGPGPITCKEWEPILQDNLAGRNIILHTDGARAYQHSGRQPAGVKHDWVVHAKQKVLTPHGIQMEATTIREGRFACAPRWQMPL